MDKRNTPCSVSGDSETESPSEGSPVAQAEAADALSI